MKMLRVFICVFQVLSCAEGFLTFGDVNISWIDETLRHYFRQERFNSQHKTTVTKFIKSRFKELLLEVKIQETEFHGPHSSVPITNIMGILKGHGYGKPDHHIYVIGSNYDSRPGWPFQASDFVREGSGVVGLMEAARLLLLSGQKEHTVLFVAFDGKYHYSFADIESCCKGSQMFVEEWLAVFLNESSSIGSISTVRGTLIIDSILNYKDEEETQTLPQFLASLESLSNPVYEDNRRGDFILLSYRSKEERIANIFTSIWERTGMPKFELYSLKIPKELDNEIAYSYLDTKFPNDIIPFYRNGLPGLFISGTDALRRKHCPTDDGCVDHTKEQFLFGAKVIYTLVMTTELLTSGKTSEEIRVWMETPDEVSSTTTQTVYTTFTECRKDVYDYEKSLDLYYKIYVSTTDYYYQKTWFAAREMCKDNGADLLYIKNLELYEFFQKLVPTVHRTVVGAFQLDDMYLWIGMNDMEQEGTWQWNGGSNVTLDNVWQLCQPDGFLYNEDCGGISTLRGELVDEDCNKYDKNMIGFICACNRQEMQEKTEKVSNCTAADYTYNEDLDLYYKIHKDMKMNWTEAAASCKEENSTLLVISNLQDYTFLPIIFEEMEDGAYFIGIMFSAGKWLFEDGSEFYHHDIFNAHTYDSQQLCGIIIIQDGMQKLDMRNCSNYYPFVCGLSCTSERKYLCLHTEQELQSLMVATTDSIQLIKFNTLIDITVLYELKLNESVYSFDGLIGNHLDNIIVWHSRESTFIYKHQHDNNRTNMVGIIRTFDPYTDIAVDWRAENIYWTCLQRKTISVVKVDGSVSKILYSGLDSPQDIKLNGLSGRLYWRSDSGLFYGEMDGNTNVVHEMLYSDFDKIALNQHGFQGAEHLALYIKKRIIYFQHYSNTFRELDCMETKLPVKSIDVEAISTLTKTVRRSYLLYTISGNSLIIYSQITKQPAMVYHSSRNYRAIRIPEHHIQAGVQSPCRIQNGNCSYICLTRRNSGTVPFIPFRCICPQDGLYIIERNFTCDNDLCYKNGGCSHACTPVDQYPFTQCSCPTDRFLIANKKTCLHNTKAKELLIYANTNQIWQVWPQTDTYVRAQIPIPGFSSYQHGGLDFDPVMKEIYWVNADPISIFKAKLHGSESLVVFSNEDHEELLNIAVDWLDRKIMFGAINKSAVGYVKRENATHTKLIETDVGCLRILINLDLFNGSIYRARNDGSHITKIISSKEHVHLKFNFAVNYLAGYIVWIGGNNNELLENATISGTNRNYVSRNFIQYTTLTLTGDVGYAASEDELWRINAKTGSTEFVYLSLPINIHLKLRVVTYGEDTGIVENCSDVASCIGHSGQKICLTSDMLCDGVHSCYGSFDEMYCSCSGDCKLPSIELECNKSDNRADYVEDVLILDKWDNHWLSKFLEYSDVFSSDCKLIYEVLVLHEHQKIDFVMYGLNVHHRLILLLFSDVMNKQTTTETLTLSGNMLCKNGAMKNLYSNFPNLKQLRLVDIGSKQLSKDTFLPLILLDHLFISISELYNVEGGTFNGLGLLKNLTITNTKIEILSKEMFANLSNVLFLNLSRNRLRFLEKSSLQPLLSLHLIDLRYNEIILTDLIFSHNLVLKLIYGDTYALCCVKPDSVKDDDCHAPLFDVSSCTDLIENIGLRVSLWLLGLFAFLSSLFVIFLRPIKKGEISKDSFSLFVANLCLADFIMGIYLLLVGVVDILFRGEYVWREYNWRNSIFCKLLGILSVISTQSSVFFISLIAISRFILVKYPFKEIQISRRTAFAFSIIAWIVALLLAVVPVFIFDDLYSVSGVCVSLPIRPGSSPAWFYSFAVFVVLNFLLFSFIVMAQWSILITVKRTMSKTRSKSDVEEITHKLLKRLTAVVLTDCLCWLPIGIMGILAVSGYNIPRDVYAWTVVFVLPMNSALNPFIYTFSEFIQLKASRTA